MIEVKNLTKNYGTFKALNDISFTVETGEIIGLLGPNGAGKTTTMRILTGYMPPSSGSATIGGLDLMNDSLQIRQMIGYMPENPPLYADMSIKAYLKFAGQLRGMKGRTLKEAIDRVAERVSIQDMLERLIKNISKGYKQRVGLAQALLHEPELLILDEPTSGLDPVQIIEIRELIKSLAGKHTVVLSSHILPEVSATCGRVVIIHHGQVVAIDTQEKLSHGIQGDRRIKLEVKGVDDAQVETALKTLRDLEKISSVPSDDDDVSIWEIQSSADVREDVFKMVVDKGWTLRELASMDLSLEEVFLKLTMHEEEM